MRLNVNQLKRVAQHLNTLRIEEKYRKIYLDCLDPTAKKRPGASECAKAELMIVQKLVARAPTKVAFVGLGASGKDPILVARTACSGRRCWPGWCRSAWVCWPVAPFRPSVYRR